MLRTFLTASRRFQASQSSCGSRLMSSFLGDEEGETPPEIATPELAEKFTRGVKFLTAEAHDAEELAAVYTETWKANPILLAHQLSDEDVKAFSRAEVDRAIAAQLVMIARSPIEGHRIIGFGIFEDFFPSKFHPGVEDWFPEYAERVKNNAGWRHRFAFWAAMEKPFFDSLKPEERVPGRYIRVLAGALEAKYRRKTNVSKIGFVSLPLGARTVHQYIDNATTVPSQKLAAAVGMTKLNEIRYADWEIDGVRPYAHFTHSPSAQLYQTRQLKDIVRAWCPLSSTAKWD